MPEMPTTKAEAIALLRKWMNEDRIIHISITATGVVAKIMTKIDAVDESRVYLSMEKANIPLGKYTFTEIDLNQAQFEFGAAEDAPEPLRTRIAGHDSLLYIYLPNLGVGLAVLPEGYDRL